MKTSLIIDDAIFKEAKREAELSGKTISEVISSWAQIGRAAWKESKKEAKPSSFTPKHLGTPKIDLSNRKNWLEELEDDRD